MTRENVGKPKNRGGEASQDRNARRRNCWQDQDAWLDKNCSQAKNPRRDREAFQAQNVRRIALAAASAALLALALCSCQSLKRAAAPVAIFDARVSERASPVGDSVLGVEFTAVNLSGRPIKSAVFYASVAPAESDAQDGGQESDWGGETYEARHALQGGLDPGGEERVFIPLEDVPPDCDADSLDIQSLCVESAEYEDGPLVFFE